MATITLQQVGMVTYLQHFEALLSSAICEIQTNKKILLTVNCKHSVLNAVKSQE